MLGTCVETPRRKRGSGEPHNGDENEKDANKGETPDELVYRDSSTFLKVCYLNFVFGELFVFVRARNLRTHTMIIVNISLIQVSVPKISFAMLVWLIALRSTQSCVN